MATTTVAPAEDKKPKAATRLASLDVFRGLTIAGMILVNHPGSWSAVYWPLDHAEWNGWTPTDLIFPFFLFIVGVSMVFSFESRRSRYGTKTSLYRHIVVRAAVIFALGLFMAGWPFFAPHFHLSSWRIPGVLQRIAVCYLLASVIFLNTSRRWRAAVVAFLLLGYWAAMKLIPVPGYGAGVLTPEGNLEAWVDRQLLMGHMWSQRHQIWDPEGVLSTLPAIGTALLGTFAGEWLLTSVNATRKAAGLIAVGAVGLAVGEIWSLWFPINKNLWTSSYVVFMGGFAAVLLGICYWLVDVKGWRRWSWPFLTMGMNPLALYFLAEFAAKNMYLWKPFTLDGEPAGTQEYLYTRFFAPLASPYNASLIWALCYVVLFILLGWAMYRARIFVKI